MSVNRQSPPLVEDFSSEVPSVSTLLYCVLIFIWLFDMNFWAWKKYSVCVKPITRSGKICVVILVGVPVVSWRCLLLVYVEVRDIVRSGWADPVQRVAQSKGL